MTTTLARTPITPTKTVSLPAQVNRTYQDITFALPGREETVWDQIWLNLWSKGLQRPATRKVSQSRGTALIPKKVDKTVRRLPETSWISALQLTMWDNIFGPRVEVLWHGCEDIEEEVQLKTARHSLSGELGEEEKMDSLIETKFHVFSELGFVMTALLFTAPFRGNITKFSFCFLVRISHLTRYLLLHPIVEDQMYQLALKLRIFLMKTKDSSALSRFNKLLPDFVANMNQLYKSMLPPVNFEKTFFYDASGYDPEFLAKAITSHLQTRHCTIVIGPDSATVNAFVDSLSLFLNPNERKLSAHATKDRNYVSDLYLQGLIAEESSISDNYVIWSRLPTTLISLHSFTVMQTHPYHQYTALRKEYMDQHMQHILNNQPHTMPWAAREGLLHPFDNISPYVQNLITMVTDLPIPLRSGYIQQQMALLARRAVLLIKYVDFEVSNRDFLEATVTRKIRSELDINDEADFLILLAIAEKLSPGIYVTLQGNPAALQEEITKLFESF